MNARAALEKGRQVQLLYLYSWFKTNLVSKACEQKKNKLYGPFLWMGFNCLRLKPLRGGSLLFTIQFPQIPGTHFIDFRRMKG